MTGTAQIADLLSATGVNHANADLYSAFARLPTSVDGPFVFRPGAGPYYARGSRGLGRRQLRRSAGLVDHPEIRRARLAERSPGQTAHCRHRVAHCGRLARTQHQHCAESYWPAGESAITRSSCGPYGLQRHGRPPSGSGSGLSRPRPSLRRLRPPPRRGPPRDHRPARMARRYNHFHSRCQLAIPAGGGRRGRTAGRDRGTDPKHHRHLRRSSSRLASPHRGRRRQGRSNSDRCRQGRRRASAAIQRRCR